MKTKDRAKRNSNRPMRVPNMTPNITSEVEVARPDAAEKAAEEAAVDADTQMNNVSPPMGAHVDLVAIGAELRRRLAEKKQQLTAGSGKRKRMVKGRVALTKDLIAVPPDSDLRLTTLEGLGRVIDGVLKSQRVSASMRKLLDEEALGMLEAAVLRKGMEVSLVGNLDCWAYEYKGAKEDEPKERSARRLVVEVGGQLLAAYPDMVKVVEEQSTDGDVQG